MANAAEGAAPTYERGLRLALVAGYVSIIVLGFVVPWQPRLFWTMLLPLLPLGIVLMGFYRWRRLCPLAFFGEGGRLLNRGKQRRVPRWFQQGFFAVTFTFLLAALVFRLLATNGDGRWLAALLIGLALMAAVTNLVFTGKTWCNFVCPVGLIERIYTEPHSLRTDDNAQCVKCTACKKNCPDIDQENAYWKELTIRWRRVAYYAFPGLVLGFYVYYWLRAGDWRAYFGGGWTDRLVDAELVTGAGFFFAPEVPAWVAAPVTLVSFSAASWLLFMGIDALARVWITDGERRRHTVTAAAAFAAFSIFYVFAGQPTLRVIAGAAPVMAFVTPVIATLFVARRIARTRTRYLHEKSAAKLLARWPFDTEPPDDPTDLLLTFQAHEHARETNIRAYGDTLRELVRDGLVTRDEMRLLEQLRSQLGITDREHKRVMAELDADEQRMLERGQATSLETRLQLESYERTLSDALLRNAPAGELERLAREYGVSAEDQERILARLRGTESPLAARANERIDELGTLRRDLAVLVGDGDAVVFLRRVLMGAQRVAVEQILDLVDVLGDGEPTVDLRTALLGAELDAKEAALAALRQRRPTAREIIDAVVPTLLMPMPQSDGDVTDRLPVLVHSDDPYVSAAALLALGDGPEADRLRSAAVEHPSEVVREVATRRSTGERFDALITIEKMIFLSRVPLLAGLDPEQLHQVSTFAREEVVEAPAAVCEEGEPGHDLFVITGGQAGVAVRADDGSEREVATRGAGDVVGELAVIDGSPRSASVRPKGGPVRILRIDGKRFRDRLLYRADVAPTLMATLAQRLRDASR